MIVVLLDRGCPVVAVGNNGFAGRLQCRVFFRLSCSAHHPSLANQWTRSDHVSCERAWIMIYCTDFLVYVNSYVKHNG